ncbi:MAG TPA: class I SAM-dependent methyltransferase, partial [Candidatus Nitrosotalea sp.]|nr:class I SAM-dependent methyltransferase [Candidatus Nitrosotalea sp.]
GKGLFLRKLVEMSTGNIGFGFDPTYVGSTNALNNRLHFDKSYYGPQCSDIHADIIVSRHVIEHIAYPLDFINTIKKTIEKSRHAKVFIETPDVEWILRNKVIWDFMYEHCSYFSAESLTTAFQIEGFEVENMKHLFNDQYLWMEVSLPSPKKKQNIVTNPGNVPQLSKIFSESEDKLKKFWKYKIENLASKGKVALWGAAGKGVTFANLIDPNKDFISCVVDVNSNKQGSYLPGTGHPIISPELLSSNKIDFAILLNPNYYDEIYNLLRTLNVNVELIDLMDENVIN